MPAPGEDASLVPATGGAPGLNDRIACIAEARAVGLVDLYGAFLGPLTQGWHEVADGATGQRRPSPSARTSEQMF